MPFVFLRQRRMGVGIPSRPLSAARSHIERHDLTVPMAMGHWENLLIIPKRHVASYFDATNEEKAALWALVEQGKGLLDEETTYPEPSGISIEATSLDAGLKSPGSKVKKNRGRGVSLGDPNRNKRLGKPDGYNVGFNVGASAGQSIFHCHIHLILRYKDDVENPRGGVRHVIPEKGRY